MTFDITVCVNLDEGSRATLDSLCSQFDALIDDPVTRRTPVKTEALQQIGSLLWSATNLDAVELKERIEGAKDAERALRLVFTDTEVIK